MLHQWQEWYGRSHNLGEWLITLALLTITTGLGLADTITLTDGTVLNGSILSEDDQTITIEAEYAGGTIIQKKTIEKSKTKEIVRSTEEQRQLKAMEQQYAVLAKYQIHPQSSYPLADYDRIINTIFLPFLTKYPDSSRAREVNDLMTAWKAERDQVAGGMVKFKGQWMARAAYEKLAEETNARAVFDESQAAVARGDYASAIQRLQSMGQITRRPELIEEAKRKTDDLYRTWAPILRQRRGQLENDIRATEQDIERYTKQKESAQAKVSEHQGFRSEAVTPPSRPQESGSVYYNARQRARSVTANPSGGLSGSQTTQPDQTVTRLSAANATAGVEMAQAVQQLNVLQPRANALKKELEVVAWHLNRAEAVIAASPPAPAAYTPTERVAPTTEVIPAKTESATTSVADIAAFAKQNWLLVLSGGLILFGFILMLTRRRA